MKKTYRYIENPVETARLIIKRYGAPEPFLRYSSLYELFIGVILTARTTDNIVNKITPDLFGRFPDPESLADAPLSEIEDIIRVTGFFRQKAKNIKRSAGILAQEYGCNVPDSIDELVKFPGIGRKSANVIIGHAFQKPAIAVDTHFMRVSGRIGFTESVNPEKIEIDLKKLLPLDIQFEFSQTVNLHGRLICKSRKPLCGQCFLDGKCCKNYIF